MYVVVYAVQNIHYIINKLIMGMYKTLNTRKMYTDISTIYNLH